MAYEDAPVQAPKFRFEWNLNTVVVLLGFIGVFVTWGYTLSGFASAQFTNTKNIERLDTRVAANEVKLRQIDNHELRLTSVEKGAADSTAAIRSLDKSVNDLSGDIRVVKEILTRIEATQNDRLRERSRFTVPASQP